MRLPDGFGEVAERLRRSTVLVGNGRRGVGSGVIIGPAPGSGKQTAIITNAHVMSAREASVQLWDGRALTASLAAHDPGKDLALLTIEAANLPAAELASSLSLRVGQFVLAVGNPMGFMGAVTTGILHAVGTVPGLGTAEYIQSDLRLAPGNSGGPLADAAGRIIGINTMISGRLALAIPAHRVRRFMLPPGSGETLGVVIRPVGLVHEAEEQMGLLILEVARGSTAEAASLMPGDILIGTDDGPLRSPEHLERALDGFGERVLHLRFLRGDRTRVRKTSVLLGSRRSAAA